MDTKKYNEWIDADGRVGITQDAQKELGEIVYIELPELDREVDKGEEVAVLESTKAAVDIYSPVTGTIIAINEAAQADPSLVNRLPESDGWLYQIARR